MNDISYRKILMLWVPLSVLLVIFYIIALYTHVGKTFFVMLNVINIAFLLLVLLFRNSIERLLISLFNDFRKINDKLSKVSIEAEYRHEITLGISLLFAVAIFGVYVMLLSVTDVRSYSLLIEEDGLLEYASAILWFLAGLMLLFSVIQQLKYKKKFEYYFLPSLMLVLFFIVCGGEEISWGQRILDIETPDVLEAINVQGELTLHDIGSISVFSNVFFLLTLIFFVCTPFLMRKYVQLQNYIHFYSLPVPNRFVIYIFLISLGIWLFIGVRFGTLGFHPFSFFAEKYYTQMDDEIFEFLAAYSFFAFSVMDSVKRITTVEL